MAVPSIVVSPSLPSAIGVSTPFSYTFSNSGPYTGATVAQNPSYLFSKFSGGTVTSNATDPTNVVFTCPGGQVAGQTNITGNPIYSTPLLSTYTFQFELPFATLGASDYTTGTMTFTDKLITLSLSGGGSNQFSYRNNSGTLVSNAYSQGDTIKFIVTNATTGAYNTVWMSSGTSNVLNTVYTYSVFQYKAVNFAFVSSNPITFTVSAPVYNYVAPSAYPTFVAKPTMNSNLLPYLFGLGTPQVSFYSLGVQSNLGTVHFGLTQYFYGASVGAGVDVDIAFTPIPVTSTPSLPSSLPLILYQPFSYTFSIPTNVSNTIFVSSNSSSNLTSYFSDDSTIFSSDTGFTLIPTTSLLEVDVAGAYGTLSTVQSLVTVSPSLITVTPAIPTTLALYIYEPFSYVFTTNPLSVGVSLQFSRSSSQISSFCALSADGQTVTFSGSYLATSSTTLNLIVDLMYGGSIVSTTTVLVTIGRGRFFPPASNQNYQLYQYEDISTTYGSNIPFLTIQEVDSVFSTPSLPLGLSFGGSCNSWYIQGVPGLQSPQSNYTVFGSNSDNGRIISVPISIKVNAQQVRVVPTSITESGLVVSNAIANVPIVATLPTASTLYFQYTWNPDLLNGFSFQDMSGNPISQGYSNTSIQLVGTPSLTAAKYLASNALRSYQVRLYATQTQTNGSKIVGSSPITFSFAETVLFASTTIPALYATEDLGYKNIYFSAATYFASGSPITSIVAPSLPAGLSLSNVSTGIVQLVGTPTVVSSASYDFTATNANGNSNTQSFTIPILPDIVSFSSDSPADNTAYSYIVSKPITPIMFAASSSANKTITSFALSLSTTGYGLYLSNASSGVVYLTGVPTNPYSQATVTITATDSLGTTAVKPISITIVSDTFTWPAYTDTYIQNKPITQYQFAVTTASGRQIQSYSAVGLPTGVTLSPGGLLTGTPTTSSSGSFTVTATTGYVSPPTASYTFSYGMIPDNVLILLTSNPTSFTYGGSSFALPQAFAPITYSGFTNAVTSVTGTALPLTATFSIINQSFYATLPTYPAPAYSFTVQAVYGTTTSSSNAVLTLSNIPTPTRLLFDSSGEYQYNSYAYTNTGYSSVGASSNLSNSNAITVVSRVSPTSIMYVATSNAVIDAETGTTAYLGQGVVAIAGDSTVPTWVTYALLNAGTKAVISVLSNGAWIGNNTPSLLPYISGTSPSLYYFSGNYYFTLNATGLDRVSGYSSMYSFQVSGSTTTALTSTTLINSFIPTAMIYNSTGAEKFVVGYSSNYLNGTVQTPPQISNFYRGTGTSWTEVANPFSMTGAGDTTSQIFDIKQATWGSMSTVVICGRKSSGLPGIYYSTDSLASWTTVTVSGSTLYKRICFDTNSWSFTGGNKIAFYDPNFANSATATNQSSGVIGYEFRPKLNSGLSSGVLTLTSTTGNLAFTQPTATLYSLYQYCPMPSVTFTVSGGSGFIYYYSILGNLPIGMVFTTETTGTYATVSGTPAQFSDGLQNVTVYAANGTNVTFKTVPFKIMSPFTIKQQIGAAAYTAELRNAVEANGAQNARDQRAFPQVDPLAGPLMGPRAPDVTTPSDCMLKLCKKPCPTCHTMM